MKLFRTLPLVVLIGAGTLVGCQPTVMNNNNTVPKVEHSADSKKNITINDLTNYKWQLDSAVDNNNKKLTDLLNLKNDVSLNFDNINNQSTVGFGVGCNAIGGSFSLKSNVLNIDQIVSTQMICDKEIDTAERLLKKSMQGTSQLTLKGTDVPLLTQVTDNGSALVWKGVMTPEAKYGVKPDVVFWQIAPKAEPCPGNSTQKCLKVREIVYNDKGIKSETRDWKLFHGKIEGYTHDDELEQIVRLKHFTVDPVDVKGKQSVYVFDRIVESGVVK